MIEQDEAAGLVQGVLGTLIMALCWVVFWDTGVHESIGMFNNQLDSIIAMARGLI